MNLLRNTQHSNVAAAQKRQWTGSGRQSWRVVIVASMLIVAAMLGQAPSRRRLMLLAFASALPILLMLDTRWLLLALPAIALFVPLSIETGTDVTVNAAIIGVVGVTGIGLMRMLLRHELPRAPSRINRPIVALVVVSLLALTTGNLAWDLGVPRPSNLLLVQGGQLGIYYLSFLAMWFTSITIRDQSWLRRLTYCIIITGSVGMTAVLASRLLGLRLPFGSSVMLNMFTVWLLPLALSQAIHDEAISTRQRRLLTAACCLAACVIGWIWFADADWIGGWLPPLVATASLLWLCYPRFRWIVVLVGIVVFTRGFAPFLQMLGLDWVETWDLSGGSRVTLWRSVFELAASRPLLGLGIAAYRHYHFVKPLAYGNALWMRPTVSAHNMFVDLFAQMGILGLGCYLWFQAETLLLSWRLFRRNRGFARGYALSAFCAMAAILIADMMAETSLPFIYNMGFSGFRASVVSWMMIGGLIALENLDKRSSVSPGTVT